MNRYAQASSRCFGQMKYAAMVPMADNLNHGNITGTRQFINLSEHLKADEDSSYFNLHKFMCDFSMLFDLAGLDNA